MKRSRLYGIAVVALVVVLAGIRAYSTHKEHELRTFELGMWRLMYTPMIPITAHYFDPSADAKRDDLVVMKMRSRPEAFRIEITGGGVLFLVHPRFKIVKEVDGVRSEISLAEFNEYLQEHTRIPAFPHSELSGEILKARIKGAN